MASDLGGSIAVRPGVFAGPEYGILRQTVAGAVSPRCRWTTDFPRKFPVPAIPTSPREILPRKPRRVRPLDFSGPSEFFIVPHC